MKQIYIITIDEVFDFEGFAHTPQAFSNEADARKEFDRIVANGKEMAEKEDYEYDLYRDSASFYKDGEWAQYHFDVKLHCASLQ